MKIYHNPRCSKSRETLQLLEDKGANPEIVLYMESPPSKTELKRLLKLLGVRAESIVRRSEPIYKEKFKGQQLSEDEWVTAMCQYPKLIERPIVFTAEDAELGRPPENVLRLLK